MDNKIVNGERAISTSAIGYKIGLPGASVVNLKRLGAIPLIESSHATYWREDDIPAIAEKVKRWLKHMDSFDPTTAGVKDVETKARKSPDKSSGKYRAEARAKLKDAILCSLRQNGATGGTALANRMEVPITHRTDFHRVLREMVSAGFIKGEFVGEVGSRKQHRQTYWIGTNGRPQPALKLASSHESVAPNANAIAATPVAQRGSVIVPRSTMHALCSALMQTSEHFEPETEAIILKYLNADQAQ